MTGKLISEEFEREHREMFRWYRSQLQSESLNGKQQRIRKPGGIVPVVLTEALAGDVYAEAQRLYVRQNKNTSQLVSVGQTADGGSFTLNGNGNTTSDIAYNASAATFQNEMNILFGAGNTKVLTGGGVWLVRFNIVAKHALMSANSSKLAGNQQVSIVATPFNGVTPDPIKVFQMMPNPMAESLPIGTIALAVSVPGLGYGILRHNKERPQVVMTGKADSAITAGSSGTVSLYRGTQDTGADITATNISDQQADASADVLIFELINSSGAFYYGCDPLDCPA